MIGAEGLAAGLAGMLLDQIGGRVDALSDTNGWLADGTGLPAVAGGPVDVDTIHALVVPQLVSPAPPADVAEVVIDDWPFLAISVRGAPQLRRIDLVDAVGDVFEVTYAARIYVWVRGDGYAQVKAVRDRLMLATREVVLANQLIGDGIRLIEQTLSEDYAPVGVDATLEATIGAGWIQAQWRSQETLAQPVIGPVASVTTSVSLAAP